MTGRAESKFGIQENSRWMNKKKSAFTLTEILLALAILGIGIVSILSVFSVGTNIVRRIMASTEASFVAQMTLEEFKRRGFSNLSVGNLEPLPAEYSSYNRNVTPNYLPPNNSVCMINLTVSGNGFTGNFTTYITRYEP